MDSADEVEQARRREMTANYASFLELGLLTSCLADDDSPDVQKMESTLEANVPKEERYKARLVMATEQYAFLMSKISTLYTLLKSVAEGPRMFHDIRQLLDFIRGILHGFLADIVANYPMRIEKQ